VAEIEGSLIYLEKALKDGTEHRLLSPSSTDLNILFFLLMATFVFSSFLLVLLSIYS